MSQKYIRVQPYNQKTGALCMRYTIGGRTFQAGEWYTVAADVADTLVDLEQESGAPVFQVLDEAGFRKVAQKELSAAMLAAGLAGLAVDQPIEMPVPKTPKAGAVKSKFEGMSEAVSEVPKTGDAAPAAQAVAKSDDAPAAPPSADELAGMDEAALLDVAEDLGVDYEPEAGEAELRTAITEHTASDDS